MVTLVGPSFHANRKKRDRRFFTPIPLIILRAFDASHSVRRTSFSSACNALLLLLLLLRFRNWIGRLTGQDQRFGDSERSLRRGMTLEFLRVCLCVRENERDSQKFCEILNYELNGFFFAVTWPILKYFCYTTAFETRLLKIMT